jgi:levansucrase
MFAFERRARRALTVAVSAATVLLICVTGAVAASTGAQALTITPADLQPGPEPTLHTPQARDPEDDFTARWTRADARQLKRMSDPTAGPRENSMPMELTMPTVPQNFPDMSNGQVWVWDTWPLTDKDANQYSFKGWEVIFSLIADRSLGFDDRHVFAKLGYFFRPAGVPWQQRPVNGGWTFGGRVFPEGASGEVFEDQSFSHQTEWSGSTRLFSNGEVKVFYTAVAFYRNAAGQDIKPADARIMMSPGKIHANKHGVWFNGFKEHHELLKPDGVWYQTGAQNPFYNFRDPFTFEDPDHPGETFMVFEGNTAHQRGVPSCTEADLGYAEGDPFAETLEEVFARGAHLQMANIGLAKAMNDELTEWEFLPPILSANCVTDQTERPQFVFRGGKAYLFTISHRSQFASGLDGPEGVYGFVGDGIRSDFQPLNLGSGLALGNPTNLNFAQGFPFDPDFNQHPGAFQAYSHYVMPGGLVQSFIDTIGTKDNFRRGGTLGPTVKIDLAGASSTVDYTYGNGGLGGYADIPANIDAKPGDKIR